MVWIKVPRLQLAQALVSSTYTPQLRHKIRCSWAALLRPSLLQEATPRVLDIQLSHPFMDSPQTMFFVRAAVPFAFKISLEIKSEYSVVLANGSYVVINSASFPDRAFTVPALGGDPRLTHIFPPLVFWALRGGGPGSWGVIIDATLRTFPIFNVTLHTVNVLTATVEQTGDLMTLHASHIKDWDNVRAGQYFYLTGSATNSTLVLSTLFKGLDGNASRAQMSAFLSNATALGAIVQGEYTLTAAPNDIVGFSDDNSGYNIVLSSRLVPESVYLRAPSSVGDAYKRLLSQGIQSVLGHLVAGGT
jgi:hypothetical protein